MPAAVARPQPLPVDAPAAAPWTRLAPIALIVVTLLALAWWQLGDDDEPTVADTDGSTVAGEAAAETPGRATQRPGEGGAAPAAIATEEETTPPAGDQAADDAPANTPGNTAAGVAGSEDATDDAGTDSADAGEVVEDSADTSETGANDPDASGEADERTDAGETTANGGDDETDARAASATGPATNQGVIQVETWEGESLVDVAERWGLNVRTLVWANDIEDPSAELPAGTLVTIPPVDGAVHEVAEGETLESIAELYGVAPVEIVNVWQNHVDSDEDLQPGMLLAIPGAEPRERGGLAHYTVKEGDNLGKIGSYYGISAYTIAYANDIPGDFLIRPGQELIIPPADGILYYAVEGETVESIAAAFGVEPEVIRSCPFNNVPGDAQPTPGQPILIPGLDLVDPRTGEGSGGGQPPVTDPFAVAEDDPAAQVATGSFMWPTTGSLTTLFGGGHNGLDIANAAWTPIVAADGGVVTFAGWNSYGLGYAAAIDHENGYVTWYGHLAEPPAVTAGQRVAKGDWLGPMGSTGKSTGPHLHFVILRNDAFQNPLALLP